MTLRLVWLSVSLLSTPPPAPSSFWGKGANPNPARTLPIKVADGGPNDDTLASMVNGDDDDDGVDDDVAGGGEAPSSSSSSRK